jgi:hypothetical protein
VVNRPYWFSFLAIFSGVRTRQEYDQFPKPDGKKKYKKKEKRKKRKEKKKEKKGKRENIYFFTSTPNNSRQDNERQSLPLRFCNLKMYIWVHIYSQPYICLSPAVCQTVKPHGAGQK